MEHLRPSVCPPARGRKKSGSTVQFYKLTKDHCQPIKYCLVRVWSMSGVVNVYRLIRPELIDVYGQISLPVHVTDAAKMLMLSMR